MNINSQFSNLKFLKFKIIIFILSITIIASCNESKSCYKKNKSNHFVIFNTKDSSYKYIAKQGLFSYKYSGIFNYNNKEYHIVNDINIEDCFHLKKEKINLDCDTIKFQVSPNTKNFGIIKCINKDSWETVGYINQYNGKLLFENNLKSKKEFKYIFKFLIYNFELDTLYNSYYLDIADKCLHKHYFDIAEFKKDTYLKIKNINPQLIINKIKKDTFFKVDCKKCENY
jgi:hypothetical protein